MSNTITVPAKELLESGVLYDAVLTDISRWPTTYWVVIPWAGSHYSLNYRGGSTEYQDNGIEFWEEPVELREVEYKEVSTMQWVDK